MINPIEYVEDIIIIQQKAWANYPFTYRPESSPESMRKIINKWQDYLVFGAFKLDTYKLSGYALIKEHDKWANFDMLKVLPEYERLAINAAIVAAICEHYNARLGKDFYISDGERNIIHITAFQDYLEKYFGFRKSYCKLNILYKKPVGLCIKTLWPLRNVLKKFNSKSLFNKINAVLLMESIRQSQR